ncbi:hypothetical protein HPB49_021777 [Dermacentor silvarum]|uniref:Uncharacterized protein n=1 Tax=Dermacentor silvarum TaxID=543639 RepID=A0ACB8CHJ8_DERSI|nr:hypothetical protein HPB49_021777 [Dermacentor silvarum]
MEKPKMEKHARYCQADVRAAQLHKLHQRQKTITPQAIIPQAFMLSSFVLRSHRKAIATEQPSQHSSLKELGNCPVQRSDTYYFKRVEFQQRGSAHVHVILWLEDAPEDEELSGAEGAMPKTLEMVDALLTLDTSLLKRPRTQTHQNTH